MSDNKLIYYPNVSSNVNLAIIEEEVLKYWQQHNIFEKSVANRANSKEFSFYDGPPFANGLPHYGHLLTGFIKDLYARFQTMKGKKVERRFGWDCHGLPAEMQAEKELGFSGRMAITQYGIDKFNDHCQKSVMKYVKNWQQYVNRQARWVDFDNSYKTMDIDFMESVIWAFKELYKKGLIYQSMRVMPYSWACETPLSNFETRLDNAYREKIDKAVTCGFTIKDTTKLEKLVKCREYKIVAWTTVPWTLTANLALAVGKDIEYSLITKDDTCYIIGKFAISKYTKELSLDSDIDYPTILGKELAGTSYQPLFNYFVNHPNSFNILLGDFVVEGEGSGIVSIAPGFGEDDQILCAKHNIELVCPVDNSGKFTSEIDDLVGQHVFDTNDTIIIKLKNDKNWIKTEQYLHNYPHCWRSDTPLIYKAVPSWYVKVTAIKDRMCEVNQEINWIPENVKDGLFGKWLENARDWSISRNRFWGTPIPVWLSDDPLYPRIDVYGSLKELEVDFGVKVTNLHRPFIDQLVRPNPDDPTGKSMMRRVEDVFDCWFESGSVPYAQVHYPFENKEWFDNHFPADFIVEYVAQTRGWFYTLVVLSTALFDRPPFKNCICHGVILDSSGQKLSKRLNNYADPLELFNLYGSDALRATMLSSTVVKGHELLIDKEGKIVYDTLRLFIKPIWNAYNFFTLYANADHLKVELIEDLSDISSYSELDKYIIVKLKQTIERINESLEDFETQGAYRSLIDFFEILNNWYIRRSRPRFWKGQYDRDKGDAYRVLYTSLVLICRAMAPLLPLLSEAIYRGLTNEESVHLTSFPIIGEVAYNPDIMDKVRDICSVALYLRSQANIRTRQPLTSVTIVTVDQDLLSNYQEIIKEEVNIKEIKLVEDIESYASYKLVINFPLVGKRLPAKMKEIIVHSKKGEWTMLNENRLKIAGEILEKDEFEIVLEPKLLNSNTKALSDNSGLVILDLVITEELKEEGRVRDLVRTIQQARKDAGFNISDKIYIEIVTTESLLVSYNKFAQYINEQTLSIFKNNIQADYSTEFESDEKNKIVIKIAKI